MSEIYEFDDFIPGDVCDAMAEWFSTRPKLPTGSLFNGKQIDYYNIQDFTIKRWMNAAKVDATIAALQVFKEQYLYVDYSALVQWDPGSGMIVHADNCDQNGEPNYVSWRKYAGVIYLNDNFAGGETFFPNQGPYFVKPKKGKMVLYPAGLEYSHGVSTVVGTRFTMPLWFTEDKNRIEV